MKLDNLSKQCVVIGSISLVISLLWITSQVIELIRILQSNYSEEDRSRILSGQYFILVAVVAAALVSILIIFGITKRRPLLMVPWLLAAFGFVAVSVYLNLMFIQFGHLEFLIIVISIIGLESVVLYPICTLFAEMRRERSNKLKYLTENKGLTVKI